MASERVIKLLQEDYYFSTSQIQDIEFLDTKIYRYFRLKDLIECLSIKKMRLTKPHLWKDPFENLFLNSKVVNKNGQAVDLRIIREQIFAQCWTLKDESDLMWNSYIHDSKGAKVTTTIKDMLDIVQNYEIAFMSGITYMPEQDIIRYFSSPLPINIEEQKNPFVVTLFIKRKEFAEEQEVRIIFHDMLRNRDPKSNLKIVNFNVKDYQSDYTYFKFDPDHLFSDIVLHPKMNDEQVNFYTKKLKGFYNGPVYKSRLYNTPEILIKIDNEAI
jgi:hypothetical protein